MSFWHLSTDEDHNLKLNPDQINLMILPEKNSLTAVSVILDDRLSDQPLNPVDFFLKILEE